MDTLTGFVNESNLPPRYGWVYLLQFTFFTGGQCYKIGYTKRLKKRYQQLDSLLPGHLCLIHAIKAESKRVVENFWHERFEGHLVHETNEWFDLELEHIEEFLETAEMRFDPDGLQTDRSGSEARIRQYRRKRRKADRLRPGS